jgi:hypothetical protein
VSQSPVAANAEPVMQQRQKWRRETSWFCRKPMGATSLELTQVVE